MKEYNKEEINRLIKNRASIYPEDYDERIIEKEIIDQLLENANWAPNHGKTEPWRFFVFSGESKKQLAEVQSGYYKENTLSENFKESKYQKLKSNPLKASHIIGIAMKRSDLSKIPEIEEIEATACAVQNMYLTATAYGLAGYWSSGGITYTEEIKEFLGLGEKDKFLGFFYLGYAKEGTKKERFRKPIEDKVSWL